MDDQKEEAIAADLRISRHTVHGRLRRLFRKLGVATRVQAVKAVLARLHCLIASGRGSLLSICPVRARGACPLALGGAGRAGSRASAGLPPRCAPA
jgi:hypothetical protein